MYTPLCDVTSAVGGTPTPPTRKLYPVSSTGPGRKAIFFFDSVGLLIIGGCVYLVGGLPADLPCIFSKCFPVRFGNGFFVSVKKSEVIRFREGYYFLIRWPASTGRTSRAGRRLPRRWRRSGGTGPLSGSCQRCVGRSGDLLCQSYALRCLRGVSVCVRNLSAASKSCIYTQGELITTVFPQFPQFPCNPQFSAVYSQDSHHFHPFCYFPAGT